MKHWTFVHNDDQGLPGPAVILLYDLAQSVPAVETDHWGFTELLGLVEKLSAERLETVFGAAPTCANITSISNEDIAAAIRGIERFDPGVTVEPLPHITPAKLTANGFSTSVIELLRGGMIGADRVGDFFDRHPVPTFGETVAEAFRREYIMLRNQDPTPDGVYDKLFRFAGGDQGGASQRAAVLAVLSYFFERCDIFEEPAEGLVDAT